MSLFFIGIGLFFLAHVVLAVPGAASALSARLGAGGRKGLVAAGSAAGLVLIVLGWSEAGALGAAWTPPGWGRHLTLALMLPALILLAAAYSPMGRIKIMARHPMLAGVKLWAFAHLVSNGEWRSIVLFGGFLAYAVVARIAAKRRGDVGPVGAAPSVTGDLIAILAGAASYGAIAYWLHPILFGVAVT